MADELRLSRRSSSKRESSKRESRKRESSKRESSKRRSKRQSRRGLQRVESLQRARTYGHVMNALRTDMRVGAESAQPLPLCGILYLSEKMPVDVLKEIVLERIVKTTLRYRSVPREIDDWTHFEEVPIESLDLDYHFQHVTTEFTDEDWGETLSQWNLKDFDADKPYWKFLACDSLPGGRPAVVLLTDHTVADGVSLVAICKEKLCEGYQGIPISASKKKKKKSSSKPLWQRGLEPAQRIWAQAEGMFTPLLEPVLPSDLPNAFKMPDHVYPSGWRYSVSPEKLDLQKFKDIKNRVDGCTVNDVMLAVTTLAVKEVLTERNDTLMRTNSDLRASFVANTRPAEVQLSSDEWVGNQFVIASVTYPMHSPPAETLLRIVRNTSKVKTTMDIPMRMVLRDYLFAVLPRRFLVPLVTRVNSKFTGTISNVFLSHERMTLGGIEIEDVEFATFTPLGIYVGILTYAGSVGFNVVLAKELGVDPADLTDRFATKLDELHELFESISESELRKIDRGASRVEPPSPVYVAILAAVLLLLALLLLGPLALILSVMSR